ncbi:MAG: OmpH family outer membrane protein [Gemmobacter sp.]|jgi:Skp family chaperone for outer membrane proteins|nr:OmpH family outer membrane protein [Gemmobacter sp.]
MARLLRKGLAAAIVAVLPLAASAQDAPAPAVRPSSPIATVQQDQLFSRTLYGRAVQARIEAARVALQTENQQMEAALEAEERSLTARRALLPAEEFRRLADAFDTRVEGIRAAQDTKARDLARRAEADRHTFFQTAVPVLADLMAEIGAVALLDKSGVLLSLDAVDITDRAVARIDSVLGDGTTAP